MMAADEGAARVLQKLCMLLHGRNGGVSLLPTTIIWRTLLVTHAGPAPGEGEHAASSSAHAGPLNAQDVVNMQLNEHMWADPADSPEVSRQWSYVGAILDLRACWHGGWRQADHTTMPSESQWIGRHIQWNVSNFCDHAHVL
jgi:hypothetical protein